MNYELWGLPGLLTVKKWSATDNACILHKTEREGRKSIHSFLFCLSLFLWVSCLMFSVNTSVAQSHSLENVNFTVLDQNLVIINYDLVGAPKNYLVELELRRRKQPSFSYIPQTVMGDIGKGEHAGNNKRIIWSMENDAGEEFVMDPFVDDYYFVVKARRKRSWFWFYATVAAAGGAYMLFGQ